MANDNKKLSEESQKKIEKFDDELGKISQRIIDLGSDLDVNLAGKLQNAVNAARRLSDPLQSAANITSQLNKLADENETLIIKRKVAEDNYVKALQSGIEADKLAAEDQFKKIIAQLKIQQGLEDQLRILQGIAEEEKRITEEKKKQNNLGEAIKKGLETNFGITRATLRETFSLVGMIDMMIKGLKNANENSVWISKNLGYGAIQADLMTMKMQAMSLAADGTNITLKNAREAMVQLAAATGGVAEFSSDALKTQIMLTKQLGLSGEEAAGIYKFSLLTGKSSERVNDEMLAAFANTRNTMKGSANFKESMAAAAKVSGQLAVKLQNNPALITKAVVQAQAFGTTLEQINKQGDDLLNWESSIEKELKAELLTGKQLNLERARAAALAGDQITLAEELQKNVGTLEDFQKMNVLQQRSLAEAMGLSVDELSDQLRKQKMAQEQGKSLAQLNAEELKAAEKRKTIQDKFNNMMEKLMDIVGSIGTLFSPIVEFITWILDHSIVVYGLLGGWLARTLLLGKGFKGILSSIVDIGKNIGKNIMGKLTGKAPTPTTPAPTPPTPPAGGGTGGVNSFSKINTTALLKGAAAMLVAAGAIYVFAKALQELEKIKDWKTIAIGIGAFAVSMGIIGVVGKFAATGLTALATGLTAFGTAMIGPGGVGLAALVVAAIGLGFALNLAAPGIKAFGEGISVIFTSLKDVDVTKILAIGPALIGIGAGLAALGAGGVVSAVGLIFGDPIKKIERLAASGDGLQKAALGLQGIAIALMQVSTALTSIDTSKLEALSDFAETNAESGIMNVITSPIKAIGNMIEGITGGGKDEAMVKAINEVRDAVNKLYAKNTTINMDGKQVGTTLTQNTPKLA